MKTRDGSHPAALQDLEADIDRGAGSATAFDLEIGRRYSYRGRKKSFLSASCPTGSWATKGNLEFSDRTRLGFTHVFTCTPRG